MTIAAMENKKTTNPSLKEVVTDYAKQEEKLRQGGGDAGQQRQHRLNRLLVRERLDLLFDSPKEAMELGLWAGYQMYEEWGNLPAAGCITAIGKISGRQCMVIANDATVKAGAMFPQSVKKVLRAQRIAFECRLPLVYLVDSAGVFLPLQEDIFPDEDDFGRIFRNNSVLSAAGIPQYAAVMGNCIAGGGYLPVLCDKLLMTEGSGLYLAGPALVKAAIGQVIDTEELGGASMHASISGTVDFHEPDEPSCLKRIRELIALLPSDESIPKLRPQLIEGELPSPKTTKRPAEDVYEIVSSDGRKEYDVRDLLDCIIDDGSFIEYKAKYGQTLVTGYARIEGKPVGIVANQRKQCASKGAGIQIGGVIYGDSADKAARFVMDCNQAELPLIFLQDVVGFMVGRDSEQSGIIRRGAKLVSAISNSRVPKITLVVGNSFGAGNYALCGKAYDPSFIFSWPGTRYAVMGADQAADTLFTIQQKAAKQSGKNLDPDQLKEMRAKIKKRYQETMDIRYAAARGWIDEIISPHRTREILSFCLEVVQRRPPSPDRFHTGVFQV